MDSATTRAECDAWRGTPRRPAVCLRSHEQASGAARPRGASHAVAEAEAEEVAAV